MLNSRQCLGKRGEESAAGYLEKEGYRILTKNYSCKVGEIDIIAQDGLVLVFIEVKTRSGASHGFPAEAVNKRKQKQISRAAQWYLAELELFDRPARFDVISVFCQKNKTDRIDHIHNAFDLCE